MGTQGPTTDRLAVFWDRDKTLIEDPGFISDPDQVTLLPGAADALATLAGAGFENIIVTNQSGIARGKFDEQTLERIHDRLRQLMAEQGAEVDAIYYCPYLDGDEAVVEEYRRDSDLRKPNPGMFIQAAMERHINLAGSWAIGDRLRDVQAGRAAGCRTILLATDDEEAAPQRRHRDVDFVAGSLDEAVRIVLARSRKSEESAADADAADASTAVLQEILSFLRTVDRRQQAEQFSFARLSGAIVQLLAVAGLLWSVFGMLGGSNDTVLRLLLTIVLQTMALTFFLVPSKK